MSYTQESTKRRKWWFVSDNLSMIIVNTYLFTSLTTDEIIKEFDIDRRTLYRHIRKQGFEPCRRPSSGNRTNHYHNKRKGGKR